MVYINKINPKISSIGCNLNIFALLEYIKNFNTSLVNLEGEFQILKNRKKMQGL
ncbi:hypothetical protein B4082_3406 [Bacillus cereus]|uniref:Uncharacterized protein n=1 Tax=Bacillus cereus TaxID=1396 RepID=A0A161RFQ8_BACCE|nr:hypothetical protein B4082_3406 [Bacillus cereus]